MEEGEDRKEKKIQEKWLGSGGGGFQGWTHLAGYAARSQLLRAIKD
jgi:hypothetical protein